MNWYVKEWEQWQANSMNSPNIGYYCFECYCYCCCYLSYDLCGLIDTNRAKKGGKMGPHQSQSKDSKNSKELCFFHYVFITVQEENHYIHTSRYKPFLWVCIERVGSETTKYFKILCKCSITNYHNKYCETSQDNYFL